MRTAMTFLLAALLGGIGGAAWQIFDTPDVPNPAPVVRITEDDPRWQCHTHGDGRCQPAGSPTIRQ